MTPNTTKREAREVVREMIADFDHEIDHGLDKAAGVLGQFTAERAKPKRAALAEILALADQHAAQSAGVEPVAKPFAYVLTKNGKLEYGENVIAERAADLEADEYNEYEDDTDNNVFAATPVYLAPQPDDRDRVIAELREELRVARVINDLLENRAGENGDVATKLIDENSKLARDLTEARAQCDAFKADAERLAAQCKRATIDCEMYRAACVDHVATIDLLESELNAEQVACIAAMRAREGENGNG